MGFCANRECLHYRRTGQPAEYGEGIERCADCGEPLVAEPPAWAGESKGAKAANKARAPLGRLAVTLGAVGLTIALGRILLPGVDAEFVRGLQNAPGAAPFDPGRYSMFSIGALTLVPFITATFLVELAALIVPKLRPLRVGGSFPRLKLHLAALGLTALLAGLQAYFMANWITQGVLKGFVFAETGPRAMVLMMAALVAGVFAHILLGYAINRFGLGNGFSLLIATVLASETLTQAVNSIRPLGVDKVTPSSGLLLCGAAFAAVLVGTMALLRGQRSNRLETLPFHAALPTCGLVPLRFTAVVATVPGFLNAFGLKSLGALAAPLTYLAGNDLAVLAAQLFAMVLGGTLLSLLFYRPSAIAEILLPTAEDPSGDWRAALRHAILLSLLFLGALVVADYLFGQHGVLFSLPNVFILLMIGRDLIHDWRRRAVDPELVKVWELHRVYAADAALDLLHEAGIKGHLRGLAHRSLLYFFGPYIPIDVLVPSRRAAEAYQLLDEHLGSGEQR